MEDDKTGIAPIAENLGEPVSLNVDVATRNFAFRGQDKRASLNLPTDVLEIKYSNVVLGLRQAERPQ